MKKIIIVVLILILATLCLTSCDLTGDYDKLNQMAAKVYSQVTIDVTVKNVAENTQLVSQVVCISVNETTKQVACVWQEYASFDVNGETITAPEQLIVTKSGTVTYVNGQQDSLTGTQPPHDLAKLGNKLSMSFGPLALTNDKTENGVFTADVQNQFLFFGREIPGATNVKVAVDVQTYQTITITYTANGNDVTIVYTLA